MAGSNARERVWGWAVERCVQADEARCDTVGWGASPLNAVFGIHDDRRLVTTGPTSASSRTGTFRYTAVASFLSLILLILVALALVPTCDEAEVEGIPRFEGAFGFHGQRIPMGGQGEHVYVITSVVGGRVLEAAGFRAGDIPANYHGYGSCDFLWALKESTAGRAAEVSVVRGWPAGARTWHRLTLPPLKRSALEPAP